MAAVEQEQLTGTSALEDVRDRLASFTDDAEGLLGNIEIAAADWHTARPQTRAELGKLQGELSEALLAAYVALTRVKWLISTEGD